MSEMHINQVLAQMRAMSAEAGSKSREVEQSQSADFSALFRQAVDTVNANQQQASAMASAFETGSGDASLPELMISMQKASVSFQAMVQVRNKLLDAYNDVMNMPM